MPSPFNEDNPQPVVQPADPEEVTIRGELFCEVCFKCTGEGTYETNSKRLSWTCVSCGYGNVVRNIDL